MSQQLRRGKDALGRLQRTRGCGQLRVPEIATDGFSVALTGELDKHTAPAVETELRSAIDAGGRHVVVDLTCATFIDSTLLGVPTAAHKQLAALDGRIPIVCCDQKLAKVFEIPGLDRAFAIHSTLDAALTPARSGSPR